MDRDPNISSPWDLIISFVLCVLCTLSIFANLIVFLTVVCSRKLRSNNSMFLLNLSICDFCLSLSLVPLTINGILTQSWLFGQEACQAVGFLISVFSIGSVSTVAVLALDRYLSIIYCLKYSSWSSRKYVSIVLMVIWTESIVSSAPAMSGHWGVALYVDGYFTCLITWRYQYSYAIYMLIVIFILPLTIIIFCYFNIIRVARLHARRIGDINEQIIRNSSTVHSHVSSHGYIAYAMMDPINRLSLMGLPIAQYSQNINFADFDFNTDSSTRSVSTLSPSRLRRQCKTIFRLLGLAAAFILCWFVHVYIELKDATAYEKNRDSYFHPYLPLCSVLLIALHTTWNPFLYAILDKNFRSETVALSSQILGKPTTVSNRDLHQSKLVSTMSRRYKRLHAQTELNVAKPQTSCRHNRRMQARYHRLYSNQYLQIPGYINTASDFHFDIYSTYP